MKDQLLKYKIAISLIPGIGSILAKKLIEYAGGPGEVFGIPPRSLERVPGIGKKLAREISRKDILNEAEREIQFIRKYNIRPLFYLDEEYPERLKECQDSPVMIYIKGLAQLNHQKIISIIGTRKATDNGREICNKLVKDLAERGHDPLIVSGLAYGIDICAHRAALKNGLGTVAVLGHGLSNIYPPAHSNDAREIVKKGALVTDFPSAEKPRKNNFIKRNRIIAGMSDATIVIESGKKGGALITADLANSYDRDVFAFPGRITDKYSAGCNKLVKTHKAALIESITDLEYMLGWESKEKSRSSEQKKIFDSLSAEEKEILALIDKKGEASIDDLCSESGHHMGKVSHLLLNLEFAGYLKSLPGKIYKIPLK